MQDILESKNLNQIVKTITKLPADPAFVDSYLTINHTCLPCLPNRSVTLCVPAVVEGSEDTALV